MAWPGQPCSARRLGPSRAGLRGRRCGRRATRRAHRRGRGRRSRVRGGRSRPRARATRDGKRISSRPLTEARIARVMAVASSACADLVPHTLHANPFARVKTSKTRKVRPLLWTPPRVERWQQTGEIPSRVMVWTREQTGEFLDSVEDERLYALFHLAAYYGPRRNELCILTWADTDLAGRRVHIRGDVKSEDSDRVVVIDQATADVLRGWRKAQLAERMAWGAAWTDSGRVF